MDKTLSDKLDDFGRRHPAMMLLAAAALAAVVTVALLFKSEVAAVLYQGF